jgi:hypothetical protein
MAGSVAVSLMDFASSAVTGSLSESSFSGIFYSDD